MSEPDGKLRAGVISRPSSEVVQAGEVALDRKVTAQKWNPTSRVALQAWVRTGEGSAAALRCCLAVTFLLAGLASAQNSRFLFDGPGNLAAQTAETTAPPQILSQPQNQVVAPGETASFSVVVADTRGLSYQWQFNGADIAGANGDALLIQNVNATNQGLYAVVLVNFSGSVTSAPATLWLDSDGDGIPDWWTTYYFGHATGLAADHSLAADDADNDGVSNFQEYLDGTNPTNSASADYRLMVLSDGGSVTAVPNQAYYTNGQTVTVTALPLESFHAWTGDIPITSSNSITLTMSTNLTVFAHFTAIDFVWTNTAGGDWFTATNWMPNFIPGSNDNAFITIPVTVTLNSNVDCGSLTMGGSTFFSTLTGTGTLTLHGDSSWLSGFMSGSGRTVVAPGATLNLPAASALSLTSRTLENDGTLLLTGAGGITLSGAVLENGGTLIWFNGGIALNNGSVLTNRAGALFDNQNALNLSYVSGALSRFDNAGTFRKSLNLGTTSFGTLVPFANYGTVDIQAGTLLCNWAFTNNGAVMLAPGTTNRLADGGAATGTFTVPAMAVVEWSGGTFTLDPGAQLNGAGLYRITGGTLACNEDLALANLDLPDSLATLSGTGTVTVGNLLNWTGGTMSGSGRTLIAPGAMLNLANSNSVSLVARVLENGGAILETGAGGLGLSSGAVLTNRAGALFDNQIAVTISYITGTPCRLDNAGTFRKSLSPGTTTVGNSVAFANYGTVDVQAGTLLSSGAFANIGAVVLAAGTTDRLASGGAASGTFSAPPMALVEWAGGTFSLNAGAQLGGGGLYRVTGATLTCNTDFSVQNLDLAGTFNGAGTVMVSNVMNWTSGFMSGSGRTLIAPGATLNLANTNSVGLTSWVLENGGTVVETGAGGLNLGSGAVITNRAGALFDDQNAVAIGYVSGAQCRLDNAGTFRKSLNPGTTTFANSVAFDNYGAVDLRIGTLTANGGYGSSTGAVLTCAIGGTIPGTNYGRVQVSGAVTVNGGLSVVLANGYLPTTNDSFTVLAAGTRTGVFTSFAFPSNQVTLQLSNTPNSVIVGVKAVAIPPPALLSPVLSSSNILLSWVAVSNTTYRVEFNPNLAPSNWTGLPGDVTASSNLASKLDALTPTSRVYRVHVLP